MRHSRIGPVDGFTLVELMLAVAILVGVLAASAQALVSYYAAMQLQHQRNVATQECRSVLSQMRNVRDTSSPNSFPGIITDAWPDGAAVSGQSALPHEQLVVAYTDASGNPLEVVVTCTWQDRSGHPASVRISTRLTDV